MANQPPAKLRSLPMPCSPQDGSRFARAAPPLPLGLRVVSWVGERAGSCNGERRIPPLSMSFATSEPCRAASPLHRDDHEIADTASVTVSCKSTKLMRWLGWMGLKPAVRSGLALTIPSSACYCADRHAAAAPWLQHRPRTTQMGPAGRSGRRASTAACRRVGRAGQGIMHPAPFNTSQLGCTAIVISLTPGPMPRSAKQAFAEWVPVRGLHPGAPDLAGCHRTLHFGDLATLVRGGSFAHVQLHQCHKATAPEPSGLCRCVCACTYLCLDWT